MGRKEDVSEIRNTVGNLEERVLILREKVSVADPNCKNDSVNKKLRIVLLGPPGSGLLNPSRRVRFFL